jgi:hypothetical protein
MASHNGQSPFKHGPGSFQEWSDVPLFLAHVSHQRQKRVPPPPASNELETGCAGIFIEHLYSFERVLLQIFAEQWNFG